MPNENSCERARHGAALLAVGEDGRVSYDVWRRWDEELEQIMFNETLHCPTARQFVLSHARYHHENQVVRRYTDTTRPPRLVRQTAVSAEYLRAQYIASSIAYNLREGTEDCILNLS